MEQACYGEYEQGRFFSGRLPYGTDVIRSIKEICIQAEIRLAWFSIIGAVSTATIGYYNQIKQEYISQVIAKPCEIISCIGNVSLKDDKLFVHAHILLGDEQGNTIGGHLFTKTILFAGEFKMEELKGPPLERFPDQTTGLMLWKLSL